MSTKPNRTRELSERGLYPVNTPVQQPWNIPPTNHVERHALEGAAFQKRR